MTLSWVKRLAPDLKLCEVSRVTYQQLLNDYAVGHERQTTMDFHHQLKGAIMDAVDDGLIVKDTTRKAIIKGKPPVPKKVKYLNQFELHLLLSDLDLQGKLNWDWMILLIAKTGIRSFFTRIIVAEEVGEAKEVPIFWEKLQGLLGFNPPHTLLIDDNNKVLRAARNYGLGHLIHIAKPNSKRPLAYSDEFPSIASFHELIHPPGMR